MTQVFNHWSRWLLTTRPENNRGCFLTIEIQEEACIHKQVWDSGNSSPYALVAQWRQIEHLEPCIESSVIEYQHQWAKTIEQDLLGNFFLFSKIFNLRTNTLFDFVCVRRSRTYRKCDNFMLY